MFVFLQAEKLLLLSMLPALAVLCLYAQQKRIKTLGIFFRRDSGWDRSAARRRFKKALLYLAVAALIIAALARPSIRVQSKDIPSRRGRDVVFLLDISRSMLARDLEPSRLERARLEILKCLDEMKNDRAGLVVFAGSSAVRCPLTSDREFLRAKLRMMSPESAASGGTRIGDAILKTIDTLMLEKNAGFQDIFLISDGEDMATSLDTALDILEERNVRLISIGLGDSRKGARIPLPDGKGYLKHSGEFVWSKMDPGPLRTLAKASQKGFFVDTSKSSLNLSQIYKQAMRQSAEKDFNSETNSAIMKELDIGILFISLALVLIWFANRRRRTVRISLSKKTFLLLITTSLCSTPCLAEAGEHFQNGNRAFEEGKFVEALGEYKVVQMEQPDNPANLSNLAAAHYKLGQYKDASAKYQEAAELNTLRRRQSRLLYDLGNSLVKRARELPAQEIGKMGALFQSAANAYTESLEIEANQKNARHNLEIVEKALKLLNKIQKKRDERDGSNRGEQKQERDEKGEKSMPDSFKSGRSDAEEQKYILQGLPQPTDNAEDILKEEESHNRGRKPKVLKGDGKVEKDW